MDVTANPCFSEGKCLIDLNTTGMLVPTVQTFTSCTSHLVVCQCLVVQTSMVNGSKKYAKHTNDSHNLRIKPMFRHEVIFIIHFTKYYVRNGCGVVYYAQAAQAFNAGIECQHCSLIQKLEYRKDIWIEVVFCRTQYLPDTFTTNIAFI